MSSFLRVPAPGIGIARLASCLLFALLCLQGVFAQSGKPLQGKRVLLLLGEQEYGTMETLPEFAKAHLEPLGAAISIAKVKSHDRSSPDCHEFTGLNALEEADVLVMSVRRRYPKTADLNRIRQWIESGKPVVALRTSSHAFGERTKGTGYQAPEGHGAWNTFDRDVLGASYQGHYPDWKGDRSLRSEMWQESSYSRHPIAKGVDFESRYPIDDKLYEYTELDPGIQVLMWGGYPQERAVHPVAWVNEEKGKRVFYTSLGSRQDMAMPMTQTILKQAVLWAAEKSSSKSSASKSKPRSKEASGAGVASEESMRRIEAAPELAIDLVSAEPEMAQPSYLGFDERGRMWVVQYRQYPIPAGLKMESRDKFWRARYNDVPPPPGHPDYAPGADIITIHEDKDGDGRFETVKPFVEGLNLATSMALGKDGIWVLQAPYLLFYHDKNGDDKADGPPEVHLSGFGIEDTHSTVNSLCWGPDGWLYAAQGSTVTASVTVTGSDAPPVKSVGQLMWRYHPEKRIYEVFSEGGGNIWSCEFDAQGRLFAGANEGGKLGYHYMQGSYNRKNFGKHGELSNPYAFGYFMGVLEAQSQRVTTNLMIYEEGVLPKRYDRAILTANPLTSQVLASQRVVRGPSFHSALTDVMLHSEDRWVRPVYLDTGPDGAVYVADWYDQQVNHFRNNEGRMSSGDGRIYRIRPEAGFVPAVVDLGRYSSEELVGVLSDERRWYRETARRLMNERQDRSVLPKLYALLKSESGQAALEALWVINLLGGLDESTRLKALEHENPFVRVWATRLIGDGGKATPREVSAMASLAASDTHIEVRQQLASTARRLPAREAVKLLDPLLRRGEDANDEYMPMMLWWALESVCSEDSESVVDLYRDRSLYNSALMQSPLMAFTLRRFAAEGTRESLRTCAKLLALAPSKASSEIMVKGFEEAYRGRSMQGLPEELVAELARWGGGSLPLRLRQGDAESLAEATRALKSGSLKEEERRRIIEALGEAPQSKALDVLLQQLDREDEATLMVTLAALQSYDAPLVGASVVQAYPMYNAKIKTAAQTLLTSRDSWSLQWVKAVSNGMIQPNQIPDYAVANMRRHNDSELNRLLGTLWPQSQGRSGHGDDEIQRLERTLSSSAITGDPYAGRDLYLSRCGACHVLHSEGGDIGPDLTGYQRQDLDSLLLAISRPSAEVREGYENYTIRTKDGQTITGFLADKDENVIVVRPIGGQKIVLERGKIESMESAGVSLMPSGLLTGMDERGIVDFFSYLRSTQPLSIKK